MEDHRKCDREVGPETTQLRETDEPPGLDSPLNSGALTRLHCYSLGMSRVHEDQGCVLPVPLFSRRVVMYVHRGHTGRGCELGGDRVLVSWNDTGGPACSNPCPAHVCSASPDVAGAWTCVYFPG